MSVEWQLKKISEVANFLNHRRVPLSGMVREKKKGIYPYFGASGIVDYIDDYIFDGTYLLISEDGENLKSRKTPIAFKANGKFWVNNHSHIIEEKEEGIIDYLEYYFSILDLTPFITGAVQPKLNKANLDNIEIPVPPLDKRLIINGILNSISDKIAINQQINQTLEEMAQALFKSWFVDFEPVKAKMAALAAGGDKQAANLAAMQAISGKSASELATMKSENEVAYNELSTTANLFPSALTESELGEIPEGWEVSNIDNVCEFQNGFAFKSNEMSKDIEDAYKIFKMGGIKKGGGLNKSGTKDYYKKSNCIGLERYIIKKGDLLMCMTDMKNNVALLGHTALMDVDNQYILNQRVGLLRAKDKDIANYPFLYILTNSEPFIEDLRSRANSGVQVNLSTKEIKETKFILPSKNIHKAFDAIAQILQEKIFFLDAEKETLTELRDSLLPKLLSGEISVDAPHTSEAGNA